jgi:L-fuculose-phosphate aldolase
MQRDIRELRGEIVEVGRRIYEHGYAAANDGNISVRLEGDRVLITPTGVSKGFMKPEDLIIVDLNGNLVEGTKKSSSETQMHLQIYKARPDVESVCHAHPPYATAFAVVRKPLDKMFLPEMVISLGIVPVVDYAETGTDEMYRAISRYIKGFDAFLLANHGALTVGNNAMSAYYRMETVEHAAMIQFIADQLGKVRVLNKKQVGALISQREKWGVRKDVGLTLPKRTNRKRKR